MNENKLNMQNMVNMETHLVEEIVKGSTDAFKRLFLTYCRPLVLFARRYVNDIHTAENIVQDVFVRIWDKRGQLNPTANIKSYLFTAVKNDALKHLRHAKVVEKHAQHIHQVHTQFNAPLSPEHRLNQKELALAVQEAVGELPEKTRLVFSMSKYHQLTYNQIAQIQEISVKTVETHMGRALKFLRKKLADFFPGPGKGKSRQKDNKDTDDNDNG